jgi:hypothetical protein
VPETVDPVLTEPQSGPQAGLPFPAPSSREIRKEELQKVRRQLREVLDLLS